MYNQCSPSPKRWSSRLSSAIGMSSLLAAGDPSWTAASFYVFLAAIRALLGITDKSRVSSARSRHKARFSSTARRTL